jgi:hypothetical protein
MKIIAPLPKARPVTFSLVLYYSCRVPVSVHLDEIIIAKNPVRKGQGLWQSGFFGTA